MIFRTIANPRRTTLAHLDDAEELLVPEAPAATAEQAAGRAAERAAAADPAELPAERTANPRRTVLEEVPSGA